MLTNFDIEKYEKKINLPNFRGVFCKDQLPHIKHQNECMIINMEDSNAGDGSHWVALYKSKKDKHIYFDSFACDIPIDIACYCNNSYILATTKQIQDIDSSMCGWFSLYLLDMMENNSINKTMDIFDFDDIENNDNIIKKYFLKYKINIKT